MKHHFRTVSKDVAVLQTAVDAAVDLFVDRFGAVTVDLIFEGVNPSSSELGTLRDEACGLYGGGVKTFNVDFVPVDATAWEYFRRLAPYTIHAEASRDLKGGRPVVGSHDGISVVYDVFEDEIDELERWFALRGLRMGDFVEEFFLSASLWDAFPRVHRFWCWLTRKPASS